MKKIITLLVMFMSILTFSRKYEKYEYEFKKDPKQRKVIFEQYELIEPIKLNDIELENECVLEKENVLITINEHEVREYYGDFIKPKTKICKKGKVNIPISKYLFNNIENVKIYDKINKQYVSMVYYAKGNEYWFWREGDTVSQFKKEYILLEPRQIVLEEYPSHVTLRYPVSKDFFDTKESDERLTEEEKKDWERIKLNVDEARKIQGKAIYKEAE